MPDHENAPLAQPTQPQVIHVGLNLPLPSALQLKSNSFVNWKQFKQAWDNYKIAASLRSQNPGQGISYGHATHLHWARRSGYL